MESQAENGNGGPWPEAAAAAAAAEYKSPDSKSSSRRSTRFKEENEYVEITLDVKGDNTVAIQSIKNGGSMPEVALLARGLEGPPAPGPGGLSSRLKAVQTGLKRITSSKRGSAPTPPGSVHGDRRRLDRSMTGAARALRGLQFLNQSVVTQGWPEVEKRFERLAVDGFLLRSRFGQCIGMVGSEEFAVQIFDALARRRGITAQVLTKDQVREFWEQLSDPGFDAKLQTFFDMVDKNADGQITEEELKEVLTLTASANKLSKILERVDEYTALIMEELDPDQLGYIEIANLESVLLLPPSQAPSKLVTHSSNISQLISQKLVPTHDRNPLRRKERPWIELKLN